MKNRPLKFRAWDNKQKKWLLGYELPNLGGFDLFGEIMLLGEWAHILNEYICKRNGHKQEDLKVMQFTGLLDNVGKEIFEGDLMEYEEPQFESGMVKGVVEYLGAGFSLAREVKTADGISIEYDDLEVVDLNNTGKIVGHIFEYDEFIKR